LTGQKRGVRVRALEQPAFQHLYPALGVEDTKKLESITEDRNRSWIKWRRGA
jgi:hypothetical protein